MDWATLTDAVSFAGVGPAVIAAAGAVGALLIVVGGVKVILGFLSLGGGGGASSRGAVAADSRMSEAEWYAWQERDRAEARAYEERFGRLVDAAEVDKSAERSAADRDGDGIGGGRPARRIS